MLFTNYISNFGFRLCGKSSIQCLFVLGGGNLAESAKRDNQKSSSSTPEVVIGITIYVVLVVVLGLVVYIAYLRKRTITKRKGRYCLCHIH